MKRPAMMVLVAMAVAAAGCSENTSRAVDEVTLTPGQHSTTQPADLGIQLIRVDADGIVVLHLSKPERTVARAPGQIIILEEGPKSRSTVEIVSSDPAKQQATIRGVVTKTARIACW